MANIDTDKVMKVAGVRQLISKVKGAINALDKSDSAVSDQFVTAVSETNGIISVSRAQPTISNVSGLQTTLNGKADSSHTHACSDITSGTFPTARIADDAITAAKVKDNETLPCNISGTAKYSSIMNPTKSQSIWSNNSFSGTGRGQHTILGTLTLTTATHTSGSTSYEATWDNVHENFMFRSRHSGDGIISVYICMPGDTSGGTENPSCVIRCFSAQTSSITNPIKCYLKKGTNGVHYTYTFTIIMSVDDYNECICFGRLNEPGDSGFTFKTSSNIITDAQLTEETYGTLLATCQYNRIGYADVWTTERNFAIVDSTSAHTGETSSVNGSANVTLKLPSTITASIVGNVTGNCSGSSGSCSGNSATATNATNDSEGRNIKDTYLKRSGGTMTGDISFSEIGTWPVASGETYPITSKGIHWSGSSDTADIYYSVEGADKGRLNLDMGDDSNADIAFKFGSSSSKNTYTISSNGYYTGSCSESNVANSWKTSRNFSVSDATSAHTGDASSVNGSANVTLKLPSTITASLVGDVTGNCSGSAGSVAWSGVTSRPNTFLKVSRGIAGCSSAFVDITTGTLNTNDVVYLFDSNDYAGNSATQIEINVVNFEGNGDHTLVCVNSTTLRFRNTSSSLDYWLKRNDNGATKVPKNNNYVDVSLEPGMVIHISRFGTTILCHSNAEWAQTSYKIAAHPDGLVDGREYNVAFVNAESSSSTQWSCLLRYDTDSLKYIPSTNTLKVDNLEGKATRAVMDAFANNIHTFYARSIAITNTKTLQLKNAMGEVINAVDLPYIPVVFDQLGSEEAVLYCL